MKTSTNEINDSTWEINFIAPFIFSLYLFREQDPTPELSQSFKLWMCIYSPQLHVSNSTYNVILVFSHTRYFKIISWDMSWKYALFANRNVGTTPKRKGQLRPKFLSYWKFPFWNLVWYFVMFRTDRQIVTFVKVGQWGCRNDEEN